ncbi:thioredoxin family protein [Pseudomonas cedrina]|uniref:thioredoxin family protein n=1 Tax=Pseudomonas cedrina TaxID=651740 RepID=UPI0027D92124|nr:thioredoxin family protein [Pseudomonas cedrina]
MGITTRKIASAKEFERLLRTPRPVFILFVSGQCHACATAGPLFEQTAWKHPWIVCVLLDCAHTPRHPDVTGTPTLLIYVNGELIDIFKGFGPHEEQAQFLEDLFRRYEHCKDAKTPA